MLLPIYYCYPSEGVSEGKHLIHGKINVTITTTTTAATTALLIGGWCKSVSQKRKTQNAC